MSIIDKYLSRKKYRQTANVTNKRRDKGVYPVVIEGIIKEHYKNHMPINLSI